MHADACHTEIDESQVHGHVQVQPQETIIAEVERFAVVSRGQSAAAAAATAYFEESQHGIARLHSEDHWQCCEAIIAGEPVLADANKRLRAALLAAESE